MGARTVVWNSTELDKTGLKCPVHQFWWHGSCWASKCSATCSRLWQCIWPLGHCCATVQVNILIFFFLKIPAGECEPVFSRWDTWHRTWRGFWYLPWTLGVQILWVFLSEMEGDINFAQGREREIWWLVYDPHAQQNINIHYSPSSAVIEW